MVESNHAALVTILGVLAFVVIGALALAAFVFWIWMLIDCAMNRSIDGTMKIVWILLILFLHLLGALIYFFVGRPRAVGAA